MHMVIIGNFQLKAFQKERIPEQPFARSTHVFLTFSKKEKIIFTSVAISTLAAALIVFVLMCFFPLLLGQTSGGKVCREAVRVCVRLCMCVCVFGVGWGSHLR